jgi:thiamine kinase-like enzyme
MNEHPGYRLNPARTSFLDRVEEMTILKPTMKTIHEIMSRIPAWRDSKDVQIERIAGLTNANYRITRNGERFMLRVSGLNTEQLGIDRSYELNALHAAAAAGIGPEVVAFLPPEGHLVTRWVDGRHWDADEFRNAEHVRLLIDTVKRIHALPLNGAVFSPFDRVKAFREKAVHFGVPLPRQLDTCLQTMRGVAADQKADSSHWQRFCHNDLVSVNYLFIESEQRIVVLDWEFSGLGDIYYDLATVVYTHDNVGPISPELEQVMLSAYFGETTALQRRRLQGMKYMLMLFTGMWGLAQHGMQKAGMIPQVDGFDYLEFSQYLFEHDIPELQEQYNRAVPLAGDI